MRPSLAPIVIGVALILLWRSPLLADEYPDITRTYSEFNDLLRQSKLDALSAFYTDRMRKSNDECLSSRACRMSDKLFREVITLTKYKLVATYKESDEKVDLRVRGTIANGNEVDLMVAWLFERGKWKIDSIAKVPTDWYPRHWNRRDDSTSGTASKR